MRSPPFFLPNILNRLLDETTHRYVDLSLNLYGLDESQSEQWIEKIMETFRASNFPSMDQLPNGSLRIGKGAKDAAIVSKWPFYEQGSWWVQDVSSTLPAIALANSLKDNYANTTDLHVVDMCAAPGGKTAQLLSAGFRVTALKANNQYTWRYHLHKHGNTKQGK